MGVFFFDQTEIEFTRGDANNSGDVSAIPDALYLLKWGFTAGPAPECDAAADVDGNGILNALTDPLYLLRWNFQGGDEPPDPGPDECGPDPDDAECEVPPECP